jgi:hypothetical protein
LRLARLGRVKNFQKIRYVPANSTILAIHVSLVNGKIRLDQNTPEQAVILYMNRHIGFGQFTLKTVGGAICNHSTKATNIQKML